MVRYGRSKRKILFHLLTKEMHSDMIEQLFDSAFQDEEGYFEKGKMFEECNDNDIQKLWDALFDHDELQGEDIQDLHQMAKDMYNREIDEEVEKVMNKEFANHFRAYREAILPKTEMLKKVAEEQGFEVVEHPMIKLDVEDGYFKGLPLIDEQPILGDEKVLKATRALMKKKEVPEE